MVREYFERKSKEEVVNRAAIKIQSVWRKYATKKAFMKYKEKVTKIVLKVQKQFRYAVNKLKETREKQRKIISSWILIQRVFRGYLVRRKRRQFMMKYLDNRLSWVSEIRDRIMSPDMKTYCKIWRQKTMEKVREKHLNARKTFVYYALIVYDEIK